MFRDKVRWIALSVACGGLVLGVGCGAAITDSLLSLGLASAIAQTFQTVFGTGGAAA